MPVSILTSLMLWSSLLAPASGIEPAHPVKIDREVFRAVVDDPTSSIRSGSAQTPCCWDVPDADTEEEETGDGDPESFASDTRWLPPHLFSEGSVSPIRRDRSIFRHSARSKILRC
jgi:hypothetical protein